MLFTFALWVLDAQKLQLMSKKILYFEFIIIYNLIVALSPSRRKQPRLFIFFFKLGAAAPKIPFGALVPKIHFRHSYVVLRENTRTRAQGALVLVFALSTPTRVENGYFELVGVGRDFSHIPNSYPHPVFFFFWASRTRPLLESSRAKTGPRPCSRKPESYQ